MARVLAKTIRQAHIALVLKSLHWLPLYFWVQLKVLLMAFKRLKGLGHLIFKNSFCHVNSWTLGSSGTDHLVIHNVRP